VDDGQHEVGLGADLLSEAVLIRAG